MLSVKFGNGSGTWVSGESTCQLPLRRLRSDGVDADVEQDGIDAELIFDDRHHDGMIEQRREGECPC